MTGAAIRKATGDDVRKLGRTLGRAFQDDPATAWAAQNETRRERFLPRYFELLVERVYLPKDEVYMTEDGMAAALWAPPERWQVPVTATLPLLPVMARLCSGHLPRAFRMVNLMEAKHREHEEPHYYLAFVGVDPSCQGQGYGAALMRPMLERCDEEGIAVYLEATDPRNQALYFRHGFEAIEELSWPGGGPPFWPMWRRPR